MMWYCRILLSLAAPPPPPIMIDPCFPIQLLVTGRIYVASCDGMFFNTIATFWHIPKSLALYSLTSYCPGFQVVFQFLNHQPIASCVVGSLNILNKLVVTK